MLENTAAKPHHVVIYARVARHEPDALHRQVAWLRQVADAHGWSAVHVITEARGRDVSDEALAALRAADVVLVAHQDRLARTPTRLQDIRAALLASGVEIVSGGSRQTEQQAERELAVLRGLARAAEATSASAVRIRTAPSAGQDARARRVPAGYQVVEPGILLDDRIVEQLVAVMRDLDRANHGRRTRAGMAAAKVQREARR
jgi:DNA invertase Pin-like site-specific DNA recombinase